jgi:hypothetical protein
MDDERRRTAADRQEGSPVQNIFFIETEAAHRRGEWEREVAAAERRAQVRPENGWTGWSRLAPLTLAYLRTLTTLRLSVPGWNPSRVKCATTLEGGHATAT